MRVYLACAMTNPERDIASVAELLRALTNAGHEVLTPHVIGEVEHSPDGVLSDAQLAARDLQWLEQADCLIAEVSTPSHGVGIEVATALRLGKPVLAVARRDARVSRLLAGLPGLTLARYSNASEAIEAVYRFLARDRGRASE